MIGLKKYFIKILMIGLFSVGRCSLHSSSKTDFPKCLSLCSSKAAQKLRLGVQLLVQEHSWDAAIR